MVVLYKMANHTRNIASSRRIRLARGKLNRENRFFASYFDIYLDMASENFVSYILQCPSR